MSRIVPSKGQDFEVLEATFGGKNKVTATIDNNKDGIYNYGKSWGDNIKVFDFEKGKATAYRLVKPGEVGMYGGTPAGKVDITSTKLGYSLKKTYCGTDGNPKNLTRKQLQEITPGAYLYDADKDGKFSRGDSLMLPSIEDKSRHIIHWIDYKEPIETILKMTGTKDKSEIKSDKGLIANEIVWKKVK